MYGSVRSGEAFDLVVVAASQGGFAAYREVLAGLPRGFPAAVVVLQHRGHRTPDWRASLLARHLQLPVQPVEVGQPPGRAR